MAEFIDRDDPELRWRVSPDLVRRTIHASITGAEPIIDTMNKKPFVPDLVVGEVGLKAAGGTYYTLVFFGVGGRADYEGHGRLNGETFVFKPTSPHSEPVPNLFWALPLPDWTAPALATWMNETKNRKIN